MPVMQGLDAAVDARAGSERGLDEDPPVIEFDGIGRDHGLFEPDRVAARLQRHELAAQTFMQMHQGGIDIVEAGDEPQPGAIEPRFALLRPDQNAPLLIERGFQQ